MVNRNTAIDCYICRIAGYVDGEIKYKYNKGLSHYALELWISVAVLFYSQNYEPGFANGVSGRLVEMRDALANSEERGCYKRNGACSRLYKWVLE